jgi:predicted DNA-binding protein (UPF0278 family)
MIQVLEIARGDITVTQVRLVMPTSLYNELWSFIKYWPDLPGQALEKLIEIFKLWLPFYSRDHVIEMVRGLSVNKEYRFALERFFREYGPTAANEYVGDVEQIGEETLYRKFVWERLGRLAGEIVFEILAVSHKLKATIVTFGERLANLAHQVGVVLVKTHSQYKEALRKRANVRRGLRLMGYVFSSQTLPELITSLGLPADLQIPKADIGLGLILIADG